MKYIVLEMLMVAQLLIKNAHPSTKLNVHYHLRRRLPLDPSLNQFKSVPRLTAYCPKIVLTVRRICVKISEMVSFFELKTKFAMYVS
jgi:hypothetical protein